MSAAPIRVLVVDDSAVVRKLVSDALKSDPEIEVVGTAVDPYAARAQNKELNPGVITLDLEMPRMDGLTFLRILMEQRPLPVIIMSSLTQRGSDYALEALRLGAFDVLAKPGGPYSFGDLGPQLIARIKASAGARIRVRKAERADERGAKSDSRAPRSTVSPFTPTKPKTSSAILRARRLAGGRSNRDLVLLGASTGG